MDLALINERRKQADNKKLLATGSFTLDKLADLHEVPLETIKDWVDESYGRCELFTVKIGGEVRVPAVLLDESGRIRSEWRPVISELHTARMSGWGMWRWVARPNAGLSGEIAAEVIKTNPRRVYSAAERRAVQANS